MDFAEWAKKNVKTSGGTIAAAVPVSAAAETDAKTEKTKIISFADWAKQNVKTENRQNISAEISKLPQNDTVTSPRVNDSLRHSTAQTYKQSITPTALETETASWVGKEKKADKIDRQQHLKFNLQGGQQPKNPESEKLREQAYNERNTVLSNIYESVYKTDKNAQMYIDKGRAKQKVNEKIARSTIGTDIGAALGLYSDNAVSSQPYMINGIKESDMSDTQKNTYYYLLGKDESKAEKYIAAISAKVNAITAERETAAIVQSVRKAREEHPIIGTATAVAANVAAATGQVASVGNAVKSAVTGKPYDANSSANRAARIASATQEGLTGDVSGFGRFLADTGISIAQFLSKIPLGALSLPLMASDAAGAVAYSAREEGATSSQAALLGIISGITEYATEKIPLDNIKSAFTGESAKGVAGTIGNAVKKVIGESGGKIIGSTVEEGLEEVISEYVGNIAEGLILVDESGMKKYARELTASGMNEDEAMRKAFVKYYVVNPLVSFAGGALSGGVMAGIGTATNKIVTAIDESKEKKMPYRTPNTESVNGTEISEDGTLLPRDENGVPLPQIEAPKNADTDIAETDDMGDENAENTNVSEFAPEDIQPVKSESPMIGERAERMKRAETAKTATEKTGILAGASDYDITVAVLLSKVFGRNIIFESGNYIVNGQYRNGTITVNANADNVSRIIAHELVHSAESAKAYQQLADFAKLLTAENGKKWEDITGELWDKYESVYAAENRQLMDTDVEKEAVAETIGNLFSVPRILERLAQHNRNVITRLIHKIGQAITYLTDNIRNFAGYMFKPDYDTDALKLRRQLEQVRDTLAKALRQSKPTQTADTGTQYSISERYSTEAKTDAENATRNNALEMYDELEHSGMLYSEKEIEAEKRKIYQRTGWLIDDNGNFVVDHESPLFKLDNSVREEITETVKTGLQSDIDNAIERGAKMVTDERYMRKLADTITAEYHTETQKRKVSQMLAELYRKLDGGKINAGQIQQYISDIADYIVDNARIADKDLLETKKRLIAELKTPVFVSEKARGDFSGEYGKIRRDYRGKINLASKQNGTPIDVRWQELSTAFPDWFSDDIITESDMLYAMMDISDKIRNPDFGYTNVYDTFADGNTVEQQDKQRIVKTVLDEYANVRKKPATWADSMANRYADAIEKVKADVQNHIDKANQRADTAETEAKKAYQNSENEIVSKIWEGASYRPDSKFVRSIVDKITSERHTDSQKRKFAEQLGEIYEMTMQQDTRNNPFEEERPAYTEQEIFRVVDKLITDITSSDRTVDDNNRKIKQELTKELRKPVYVPEASRSGLARVAGAESYNNLRKQYYSRVGFANSEKGVPIAERYAALAKQYPQFFKKSVTDPIEQAIAMITACDTVNGENYESHNTYGNDYGRLNAEKNRIYAEIMNERNNMVQTPRSYGDAVARDIRGYMDRYKTDTDEKADRVIQAAIRDADRQVLDMQRTLDLIQQNAIEHAEELQRQKEEREAHREQRRHRAGRDIDTEKIDKSIEEGTYYEQMQKLYAKRDKLAETVKNLREIDPKKLTAEEIDKIEQADDMIKYINAVRSARRKSAFNHYTELFTKYGILDAKDKINGLAYARETMSRNISDVFGQGRLNDILQKEIVKSISQNEASATKTKNAMRKIVRELNLSTEVYDGNKLSESAIVQALGEAESCVEMMSHGYGLTIDEGGRPTRYGRTIDEWKAVADTIKLENRNVDWKKIENSIEEFRKLYDTLFKMLNMVRITYGYEPIKYLKGYFPHYNAEHGGDLTIAEFFKDMTISNEIGGLPTSINGITQSFRPGMRYFANTKSRNINGAGEEYNGIRIDVGAVEGFDRYIESAADIIYHTGDVTNLRAMSDAIRYISTDEATQKQMDIINHDVNIPDDEKRTRIGELFSDAKHYTLRNFVVELEEYGNLLAGKRSLRDRQWEQMVGRGMYQITKAIEKRFGANTVTLNVQSWLTNFVPLAQGFAEIDGKDLLKAMAQTIMNIKQPDGFASDFLINRKGSDRLIQTNYEKMANKLSSPMTWIDNYTTETLLRARTAQNQKLGMSYSEALDEANTFVSKLMGGRAKGEMPTLFYQSNPVTKMFTQFQLEVNNQWSYMLKDIPQYARMKGTDKKKKILLLAYAYFKLALASWLYNEIYERITGRRCAFDVIDIVLTAGTEFINGNDKGVKVGKALTTAASETAEQLPFISAMGAFFGLDGGRIPLSSAIPNLKNIASGLDAESLKKSANTIGKELAKPLYYLVPPFGGSLAKKAVEGTQALIQGGSYKYDKDGNRQLQYIVPNRTASQLAFNIPKAIIIGKTSTKYGKEWAEQGFPAYTAKQTKAYEALAADGRDQKKALDTMNAIRETEKRKDKIKILLDYNCTDAQKKIVYDNIIDTDKDHREKVNDTLKSSGIAFGDFLAVYDIALLAEGDDRRDIICNAIDAMRWTAEQKNAMFTFIYPTAKVKNVPWNMNN